MTITKDQQDTALERLRAQRQQLSLDVVDDPDLAGELEQIEIAIMEAERDAQRRDLAAAERQRRDTLAADQAAEQRRQDALDRARELDADRQRSAQAFDRAARKLAGAIAEMRANSHTQAQLLADAGVRSDLRGSVRLSAGRLEAAIVHALRDAGVSGAIGLPPTRGSLVAPLSDVGSPVGALVGSKTPQARGGNPDGIHPHS
jgi:multidrug resistance efflux pump